MLDAPAIRTTQTQAAHKAAPDFNNLLKVLRREVPARPTLFEFFMNPRIYQKLTGHQGPDIDPKSVEGLRLRTRAFAAAGYDYATLPGSQFAFPAGTQHHGQSVSMNEGAVIHDRASFEAYVWPHPNDADYTMLSELENELSGGMKFIVSGPGGLLENVMRLVGYENTCLMTLDDPELAQDIFDEIGSRLVSHYERALAYRSVGACIVNDDWGFKTQPMLSPTMMRRYVIPWHKRIVEVIHKAGRPAILHSCGNLHSVMDDIIDVIKFDGKHSFEDNIQPVEQAYEQYGRRIAIMGGLDLHFVCSSTPDQVYSRAKAMLERAAERGGFALGTGNSVPEYVPHANYFALLRAAVEERGIVLPE